MGTRTLTHSFQAKLRQGEAVERDLDEHFSERYSIRRVSMDDQRNGIDRVFTDRESGERFRVEYKADWRATDTGNAFIGTVSVDTTGVQGWALTSQADWVVYALPPLRKYLLIRLAELRAALTEWCENYPTAGAKNRDYTTHGVLVPLMEFAKLAHAEEEY
ncbi:MAG: hypothetical protein M3436_00735 [Pseudomonadota bacterium]|nr:hypothetical protein [Pseudomonadota bacterium]